MLNSLQRLYGELFPEMLIDVLVDFCTGEGGHFLRSGHRTVVVYGLDTNRLVMEYYEHKEFID